MRSAVHLTFNEKAANATRSMRVSLSIRLCKAKNIHTLLPTTACSSDEGEDDQVVEAWLSYRLGTVIQSPKFELFPTRTQNFEAIEDVFHLSAGSSMSDLISSLLSASSFDVYICTHGSLLGRTKVNIQQLLALNAEGNEAFAERSGKGTFYFTTEDTVDGCRQDESAPEASVEVSMSLKRESFDDVASRTCKLEPTTTTTSCQTAPFKPAIPQHQQLSESSSPSSSAIELASPPAPTPAPAPAVPPVPNHDERIQFEKERRRWEEWRHKEEIKWHNKMREQETAALKALDEQSKAQERQSSKEMEAKKKEFENLEGRLRKALAEVEKRERRIRTVEASREAEYVTKMAEVELKQKLLKEEFKHAAEIESAKLKAANERVAMAEKATAVAEERVREIELNFEAFKKAYRESHEGSLQQEISTLKGELVAAESRINKAVQEKNEANFEKEQNRVTLHKVAKALKKEKLKVQAMEEKERQQFLLERKRHCLERSNNREELMRITSQLQGLDTNAGPTGSDDSNCISAGKDSMPQQKVRVTCPLPAPLTPPRHPLSTTTTVSSSEADRLRHPVGLGKTNLDAHCASTIQATPATKIWNGTAIDTTRHMASDSKVHLSRR